MTPLIKPMLFLATSNAAKAREFYEKTLGLQFESEDFAALVFRVGGSMLRIQKVKEVRKAQYTALGWEVEDIHATVKQLRASGVVFQRYEGVEQDEDNVWRSPSGAQVAWFEDPDGNILSLTQFK